MSYRYLVCIRSSCRNFCHENHPPRSTAYISTGREVKNFMKQRVTHWISLPSAILWADESFPARYSFPRYPYG